MKVMILMISRFYAKKEISVILTIPKLLKEINIVYLNLIFF